ncbi:GTPase IMAP family member 4-like [Ctenopharyngodon idella]|uniref:GTPase IMAP family member 4-like n=1 Tax=Ctenopharyngodon idella TaxID=7959 RepID=UPI00222FF49D|nr:GTPase IMAP family member 4-like [Ctenopharyngodon idella]
MEKLRIVLLGKQGAGKSASGNTLLGCHPFYTAASSERVTQACSMRISTVDEQTIEVIDTPGWCDSSQFETEMKQEIINYINMCMPHVFLLVLPIGRFTNEEINTVMNILKEFGDEVNKYMIVLFTKGDELDDRPIEDYLEEVHPDLKKIIQICGERYHVFNNRNKKDHQQISSLLKKINDLVEKNEKNYYTKAMYEKNKTGQKPEANNSFSEKIKRPAENEKRHDDQGSSCDADEKEKKKGETLVDRKELEKLKKNMDELTNTIQNTEMILIKEKGQCKNDIQKLERELKKMQVELVRTKNELQLLQQKVCQNEQLQQEYKKRKEMQSKPK